MSPQLHHYVPQFVLHHFTALGRNHLHVFDKHTNTDFAVNPAKMAAIKNYYDFDFEGQRLTLEPALSEIESKASEHIKRIITDRQVHVLDSLERDELCRFFAVQMVRTPAVEITWADIGKRMETWLRANGMPDSFFAPDPAVGEGPNAERVAMARNIVNAPDNYGSAFAEKDWVLLETDLAHPFLIGDHPLTMHNMTDRGPRGNLGLKVEGIELYFPLSPEITLALWCPSLRETLIDDIQRMERAPKTNPHIENSLASARSNTLLIVEAIRAGKPLKAAPQNVEFCNSLQIATAERFVFSATNDFALVKNMLQTNPELRYGRRVQEGTGKF